MRLRGASSRSERRQNRKRNHPRPRVMDTSRVDGVKAPQHRGTPRSHDVVVDRLGHADDGDGVVVALEVLGDLGRLRVRVVAADRVEDGHLIHH